MESDAGVAAEPSLLSCDVDDDKAAFSALLPLPVETDYARLLALIDPGTRPELTVYRLLVSELPVDDKAVVVVFDVAF